MDTVVTGSHLKGRKSQGCPPGDRVVGGLVAGTVESEGGAGAEGGCWVDVYLGGLRFPERFSKHLTCNPGGKVRADRSRTLQQGDSSSWKVMKSPTRGGQSIGMTPRVIEKLKQKYLR